ncbi:MAG TPA: ATP-binding protein [Thermomicrobiales bacterium]|nr:ATP-binding protein [Thermomicrobiales bacterium]
MTTPGRRPTGSRREDANGTRQPGTGALSPRRGTTRSLATVNLLLANVSDGVILLDGEGRIIDANDAAERLFGEPIEVGTDPAWFIPRYQMATPDGAPLPVDRLPSLRALAGESVRSAELSITRPDGSRVYVSISASPVIVHGGIDGVLLILNDISERVRRDREAAAFQTLSQQLASSELDLNNVYKTIVTRIAEITGARVVRLMLHDPVSRTLRRAAIQSTRGMPEEDDGPMGLSELTLDALAARTRLPVIVPDFDEFPSGTRPTTSGAEPSPGAAIAVPLIVHSELVGTLSYDLAEPHVFDDAEIAFLGMIAAHSAVAIYNATLFQQRTRERAFLADIIDHLPAGLIVFDIVYPTVRGGRAAQADYRVSMLNGQALSYLPPRLVERTRSRRNGIVGLRLRRIATDEQSRRLIELLDQAFLGGEIVTGEEGNFGNDGAAGEGENWWNGSIVPLRDRAGRVSELVLLATDITEQVTTRRRIEELVRIAGTRAAELEATVSAMTGAVTVCDATGRLRLANSASLATFGVDSLAELMRISGLEERILLRHTDGRPVQPADRPLVRALAGETLQADYTLFHHGTGRDVHRRTSAAPVRDGAGDIIGAVAVETDITSLIEIDRLKDEFFSMAAHELRTPLTAIKGYVQILAKQLARNEAPSPMILKSLTTLREQGERMERLINELLDFARVETGQLAFRYREFDLIALLEESVAETARATQRHWITLKTPHAVIQGRWDRDRLAQVFANLLTNAVKYSPDGGAITVAVGWSGRREDDVTISITDEGLGIPAQDLPRLFARYSRVGDSSHFHRSGLGIGLYITKEIVDSHGGTISASSQAGHGSTFTVMLPLQPRRIARPAPSDQPVAVAETIPAASQAN